MKKILLLTILLLPNIGCGLFEMEQKPAVVVPDSHSDIQKKIIDSLQDSTKDDCETIYKVFSGITMYLENNSKLTKFSEVLSLIAQVEEDYKWSTDTYVKLTDVIETDLSERGYQQDKELDEAIKKEVISLFQEYSNAVLIVLKAKNAER